MTVMVFGYSWLGFYTFTGYYYVYRLVGSWRWRIVGIGVVACLAGISQGLGLQGPFDPARALLLAGAILVNVILGCAFTWFNWVSHRQGLTGIITQLQAAEQAADDPAGWRRHFDAATGLARESLSEARRSVEALRPESLETARLSDALADVAGRWSALHGIPVQVTTTGTARPMPPEAEFALLRTAQEALANVAKHAAASRVGVTLSYMEHDVALDVRDDGRGFDLRPVKVCAHDGGFGLVAMRQRIESLAGRLQVESEPGTGTGISACLPLAAGAEARP
jgi:signal transduction histidine kinase